MATQGRQPRCGDVPYDGVVDSELVVNQPVSHPGYLPPLHLRRSVPKILGDAFRRLADGLQTADERPLQRFVLPERLEAQSWKLGQDLVDLVEDMADVLTRR